MIYFPSAILKNQDSDHETWDCFKENISQNAIYTNTFLHHHNGPFEFSPLGSIWSDSDISICDSIGIWQGWSGLLSRGHLEISEMKINTADDRFRLYKMMDTLNQCILSLLSVGEELRCQGWITDCFVYMRKLILSSGIADLLWWSLTFYKICCTVAVQCCRANRC